MMYVLTSWFEKSLNPATMAAAINPISRPYSIAVAPD